MPEIVQDIGAYAGLASILGLAVLSALYFSQARDVKRLREWAGRAPERAADTTQVPGRVPARPQPQPGAPAAPAPAGVPAKAPVPAPAGGAGNRPGPPGVPTPTSGAPKPPAGPPVSSEAPVPAGATAAAGTASAATAAGQHRQAASNAGAGASAVAARPSTPATAGGPATPAGGRPPGAPPVPAAPRPISQPTTIIPPEREQPGYRRLLANPLYIVLTIAGVLVLGGAAVFAVSEITGDDTSRAPERQSQAGSGDEPADNGEQSGDSRRKRAPVDPSSVTVAVLNGTTVPGLAARVADEVKSFGFQAGTVANAPDQNSQRAESVVLYAPGHGLEASAVSRRLDIPQREQVDPQSRGLAGDAGVVVVAGGDRAAE